MSNRQPVWEIHQNEPLFLLQSHNSSASAEVQPIFGDGGRMSSAELRKRIESSWILAGFAGIFARQWSTGQVWTSYRSNGAWNEREGRIPDIRPSGLLSHLSCFFSFIYCVLL